MTLEQEGKPGITLNDYQDKFVYPEKPHKFIFLKSGWGTGKSLALIMAGVNESLAHRDNLGVIFRKEFVDLKTSTIKDFETYTGRKVTDRQVRFQNKSQILFMHIEELNNIGNMNLGWFGIEQGEELETDKEFYTLFGRLRRLNASRRGFIISNAKGDNWIRKIKRTGLYAESGERIDLHLEADTYANKHNLPADFFVPIEILKVKKPGLYSRFVLNLDDDDANVDLIISPTDVRAAIDKRLTAIRINRIVVCDPARFGDDETVIFGMENGKIIEEDIYIGKSTMETAGRCIRMKNKIGANMIGVDVIGVGGGVVDRLDELRKDDKDTEYSVYSINSAEKSGYEKKFKNKRAEIWEYAAEQFRDNKVSIPDDEILIEQLSDVRYKVIESNGRVLVESKEDIKKRLNGKSPDRADALVMGLWLLQFAEPVKIRDRYKDDYDREKSDYIFNSETC